jgi:hypothetical protein
MWGLKKMKPYINKPIRAQPFLDSGKITPMTAIMHRFTKPGTYNVNVFQGENQTATFPLIVDENAPKTLNRIDLGSANCSSTVNPTVPTVFHAPRGTTGYSFIVEKFDGGTKSKVFDNKSLQDGDIFFATLLRPGEYQASNQLEAKCKITVSALKTRRMQFTVISQKGISRPKIETFQVECATTGFKPEKINIQPAQPLMFMIKAPSRIKIEYETAKKQTEQSSL